MNHTPFELYKPNDTATFPFSESQKYDILTEAFKNTKGAEYMAYFNVNWNEYTEVLSKKQIKKFGQIRLILTMVY